mmetsp:Transcript_45597/g.117903  ORF Transcript_45597/g.117903 Transcript_45597/m.117903 type:complete len:261 (-) Transcript_45597:387-1169(-)
MQQRHDHVQQVVTAKGPLPIRISAHLHAHDDRLPLRAHDARASPQALLGPGVGQTCRDGHHPHGSDLVHAAGHAVRWQSGVGQPGLQVLLRGLPADDEGVQHPLCLLPGDRMQPGHLRLAPGSHALLHPGRGHELRGRGGAHVPGRLRHPGLFAVLRGLSHNHADLVAAGQAKGGLAHHAALHDPVLPRDADCHRHRALGPGDPRQARRDVAARAGQLHSGGDAEPWHRAPTAGGVRVRVRPRGRVQGCGLHHPVCHAAA